MSFKKQQTRKSTVRRLSVKLNVNTEDKVKELLKEVKFDIINISLSTKKSYVGMNGNGYTQIGFVNGYNSEENTFDVVVFENRFEAVKALGDVEVMVRSFKNRDGEITKIISLDLTPTEDITLAAA